MAPGTIVRLIHNPQRVGVVVAVRSGGYVVVQFGAQVLTIPVTQLEEVSWRTDDLLDRLGRGQLSTATDLRRALTSMRLCGRLADMIYSMEATHTDFYAHQFKPVLKLLGSPTGGLLVADEVGLGKTIEAGLIWTELRARFDTRRLLVLCPKTLCQKWREELFAKFAINAEIMTAGELADRLANSGRRRAGFAAICSLQGARPPRDWQDGEQEQAGAARLARCLADFATDQPVFDLLVIDEAHHLRNTATQTHLLGRLVSAVAEHRVFLSATPIHLRNRDLFALLRLLDTENFADAAQFERLLDANRPLVKARDALLRPNHSVTDVLDALQVAADKPMLAFSRQLATIREELSKISSELSPEMRADYAERIERVSLLSNVVTRTRRRDVQELRVERKPVPEKVTLSPIARNVYDQITALVQEHASDLGVNDRFLLATPQRLLASCIPAAVAHWRDGAEASEDEADDDPTTDERPLVRRIGELCQQLPSDDILNAADTKFDRFYEVMGGFLCAYPDQKLVVFSSFRPTLRYLDKRLTDHGLPCAVLHGAITEPRSAVLERFASADGPRVLLTSEIGGEGIDLQFCRAMVNYDMPWNPMRVEQRIGRIDRLGQAAEQITIWNLLHADTIDERIYNRLYQRLDLCRQALGDFEDSLGDQHGELGAYIRALTAELLAGNLTEEQLDQRFRQDEIALANRAKLTAQLEEDASTLIAHEDFVMRSIRRARDMRHWIAPDDILWFLSDSVARLFPGSEVRGHAEDRCEVRLSDIARDEYLTWCRAHDVDEPGRLAYQSPPVALRLGAPITTAAGGRLETLNQTHPFIRFVAGKLENDITAPPRPAVAVRVGVSGLQHPVLPGVYVLLGQEWRLHTDGATEVQIAYAGKHLADGSDLTAEQAEALCLECASSGTAWPDGGGGGRSERAGQVAECLRDALQTRFDSHTRKRESELHDTKLQQLRAVDAHERQQMEMLESQVQTHRAKSRDSLVAATLGRMEALKQRCESRRSRIEARARLSFDFSNALAVLVDVTP